MLNFPLAFCRDTCFKVFGFSCCDFSGHICQRSPQVVTVLLREVSPKCPKNSGLGLGLILLTLRILGPSNGGVGTCIAGVRVLKIGTFEGSGYLGQIQSNPDENVPQ